MKNAIDQNMEVELGEWISKITKNVDTRWRLNRKIINFRKKNSVLSYVSKKIKFSVLLGSVL